MRKTASEQDSKRVHPEDIKARIRKTEVSLADLSAQLGYSRGSVSLTLYKPWPAVEAAIAQHLGVKPQTLWPERYDADGHPKTFPAAKRSRAAATRHRQKSMSA